MTEPRTLDDLWETASRGDTCFAPDALDALPEPVQRYLSHAIVAGTPLASSVRLTMHGAIKLKVWCPFTAEEVIRWDRGFVWRARVRFHGLPLRGSDRFVDGAGAMHWALFGIIPIASASGRDITRSAAGRMNIEAIWLPLVFCGGDVAWSASSRTQIRARFTAHGEHATIDAVIDEIGRLCSVVMPRWGNPDGGAFGTYACGAFVDQEASFDGYTIPSRVRVGWHFGSERFAKDGEFFRAIIDRAVFR
jgi:hypothetical protein